MSASQSVIGEIKRRIKAGKVTVASLKDFFTKEAICALEEAGAIFIDWNNQEITLNPEFPSCQSMEIYL